MIFFMPIPPLERANARPSRRRGNHQHKGGACHASAHEHRVLVAPVPMEKSLRKPEKFLKKKEKNKS